MKSVQNRDIDGIRYDVSPMPASKALKWLKRLQGAILPALGRAAGAVSGEKIDGELLGNALAALGNSCSEAEYEKWIRDLLEGVRRDHKEINFEIDFMGEMLHLHKLCAFILEVNFSDFLGVLKGKTGGLLAKFAPQVSQ